VLLGNFSHYEPFFESIRGGANFSDACIVAISHILPDRRWFLPALNRVAKVSLLIGVPYSVDQTVRRELEAQYRLRLPTLDELRSGAYLDESIQSCVTGKRIVLIDIGGYFSSFADNDSSVRSAAVFGAVEDTENGHRRYADIRALSLPVFSVARSSLKISEDLMVGSSVLFSLERILREESEIFQPQVCLVLGFGKVGKGVAIALRSRNARVLVYDSDPIRRIEALGWGFSIPERAQALCSANIIIGATGCESVTADDLDLLKDGTILVSASSKDVEFPLEKLRKNYRITHTTKAFEKFDLSGKNISVLYGGYPINFRDHGVVGPFLALSQAEIMLCIIRLLSGEVSAGLHEIEETDRTRLANEWLRHFVRGQDGVVL
jgi:adenosylhomocysteinase